MLKSYFKMAWRSLVKNKVSSIINISGLAVGLATGIIMLLVIVDEFSYDHFNTNLRDIRLLMKNQDMHGDINTSKVTPGLLAASVRNEIPDIKYAARSCGGGDALVRNGDKDIYLESFYAEPDFFNIMTFPSVAGNPVTALEDPGSVILVESAAKKLFGNEDPVGKTITHNVIHNLKVAAVIKDVPQNSSNRFDMVLSFRLFETENEWLKKWDDNRIQTWVQVKPHTSETALNAKLRKLFLQKQDEKNMELFAYPLAKLNLYSRFRNGKPAGGLIDLILLLACIALFVLLIACINFMNLATARSEQRAREVGVRKVMGASRKLIILQFMGEALLMSLLALILGIVLANIFLPGFMQLSGKHFTPEYANWKLWALLVSLGLFTGIVAGSYPALYLSRFQPVKVLKKLMVREKGGGLLRKSLVTFQFMISIFLIIGTIVIFKQIKYVQDRPIGYNPDNLIDINAKGDMGNRVDMVKNELRRLNGVKAVTATSENLVDFGGSFNGLEWPGKTPDQDFYIVSTSVQYDWIKTAGLQLVDGRDFSPDYGTDSLSCLINETAAKRMDLQKPVGTKLGNNTVIGVVKDFVYNNPTGPIAPMIIYLGKGNMNHFLVRIANNDKWRQCIAEIEKTVRRINPNFPFEFRFTKDNYQQNFHNIRSIAAMANSFGVMAIFISCLGLFGLSAFLAERRRKEVSIRKVLGASVSSLWFSLSKDFLKPVFVAFILSAPLAAWVMQEVLQTMDYHTVLSWWIFAAAGVGAVIIAVATVSFHGIKAAKANPAEALQSE